MPEQPEAHSQDVMPQATTSEPLLEVRNLHATFHTEDGIVKAVNGVSFTLKEEMVLGLVGESGSGKTATALSLMRLLPYPGRIEQGEVYYKGRDLLKLGEDEMRDIRGQKISMAFQEASAALNPVLTVGAQIRESLLAHQDLSPREVDQRLQGLLQTMGLPGSGRILDSYPFQMSGGMAQRVLLALALAPDPTILIADEPTSNLDVTIQAEILERLKRFQREQRRSMVFITHDMGVIARMAQEVAVMYAGSVVEHADTVTLFQRPMHPYTWGLLRTLPRIDQPDRPLIPMAGQAPTLIDLPDQCPFLPRCPKATNTCRMEPRPPLTELEPGHTVACYNPIQELVG